MEGGGGEGRENHRQRDKLVERATVTTDKNNSNNSSTDLAFPSHRGQ